ncbi:hypothetical protein KY290_034240 [Solanum tuberosum]|uniref:Aminotransferase-like plant mobile domain-containing protein n=1 Tax=Solanum tuberosum TaxID=4113 RepID=A0ABQ7U4K7_SOLTU|nr:hypothetical protein KY289_033614 [Solanum tuberosum]KAH0741197.1 hypothetical protein KY290_034240 [Solanum tuberosum]
MTPTLEEIASFMGKGSSVWGADLHSCNILLQIWFLEHLYHRDRAPSGVSFLVLIGLRCVQPYAPLQIWFGSIISELSEMVVEQDKGKVVSRYLLWFRDPVTFGDIPERSNRERKDQHIIRQLEKELEKAKGTTARQEVQRDLVASEEVVHYQNGELKRHEEKFEKERSCWMRLHDQLNAPLKEHKRKIRHCVDIKEGQRQMIIERATLHHQLEAAEEARHQVYQLVEQTSYVIKNHRRMNNPEVAEQARAIVPHLPKVLLNLYETLGGQRKPKEDDED